MFVEDFSHFSLNYEVSVELSLAVNCGARQLLRISCYDCLLSEYNLQNVVA